MAEEEEKKEEEPKEEEKKESSEKSAGGKTGIVTWIIIAAAVSLLSGSGFFLGRLIAGSGSPKEGEAAQEETQEKSTDSQGNWFSDLEPVVANLNVPGATRYVRASITMEMNAELIQSEGEILIEAQKPILRNWLAVYLASLSIEDARGDRNLKRIQLEILDSFNEILFPDSKPLVKQILFKEGFAIQ